MSSVPPQCAICTSPVSHNDVVFGCCAAHECCLVCRRDDYRMPHDQCVFCTQVEMIGNFAAAGSASDPVCVSDANDKNHMAQPKTTDSKEDAVILVETPVVSDNDDDTDKLDPAYYIYGAPCELLVRYAVPTLQGAFVNTAEKGAIVYIYEDAVKTATHVVVAMLHNGDTIHNFLGTKCWFDTFMPVSDIMLVPGLFSTFEIVCCKVKAQSNARAGWSDGDSSSMNFALCDAGEMQGPM